MVLPSPPTSPTPSAQRAPEGGRDARARPPAPNGCRFRLGSAHLSACRRRPVGRRAAPAPLLVPLPRARPLLAQAAARLRRQRSGDSQQHYPPAAPAPRPRPPAHTPRPLIGRGAPRRRAAAHAAAQCACAPPPAPRRQPFPGAAQGPAARLRHRHRHQRRPPRPPEQLEEPWWPRRLAWALGGPFAASLRGRRSAGGKPPRGSRRRVGRAGRGAGLGPAAVASCVIREGWGEGRDRPYEFY